MKVFIAKKYDFSCFNWWICRDGQSITVVYMHLISLKRSDFVSVFDYPIKVILELYMYIFFFVFWRQSLQWTYLSI